MSSKEMIEIFGLFMWYDMWSWRGYWVWFLDSISIYWIWPWEFAKGFMRMDRGDWSYMTYELENDIDMQRIEVLE